MSEYYKTAKTQFYNPNGTGRDGYIYESNGGHAASRQPNKQPGPGTADSRELHMFSMAPYIHSKPVQYVSDGTGRDSYIQISAGGLNQAYRPGQMVNHFLTSLRSGGACSKVRSRSLHGYKARRVPYSKTKDHFLEVQDSVNFAHLSRQRKLKNYQT